METEAWWMVQMVGAVQHQTTRARQSLVGPEGSTTIG